MTELESLKAQLEEAEEKREEVYSKFMNMASENVPYWDAYNWYKNQHVVKLCDELIEKIKMLETEYELSPIPKYADLMTIEDFIECCENELFIDSDGIGYYATKDKESSIEVCPSEIMSGRYRKDFTHVTWYNK